MSRRDEQGVFLSAEEMLTIAQTVERWEKDSTMVTAWARRVTSTIALVLEKVIEKASGRRAAQDISVAADRLAKVVDAMHKAGVFQTQILPDQPKKKSSHKSKGGGMKGETDDVLDWQGE